MKKSTKPEIPWHVHDEQIFLTQVVCVKRRTQMQVAMALSDPLQARMALEKLHIEKKKKGTDDVDFDGEQWRHRERGQESLSSVRLLQLYEKAYGSLPDVQNRPRLPKSEWSAYGATERSLKRLFSKHAQSENHIYNAIGSVLASRGVHIGTGWAQFEPQKAKYTLPAVFSRQKLGNSAEAVVWHRMYYSSKLAPTRKDGDKRLEVEVIESIIGDIEE